MQHSELLGQLACAKARAQVKFSPLGKDKSANIGGKYSYRYADLATCLDAVMAALSEQEIAVFQPTRVENGAAVCETVLVHSSGEWISGEFSVSIVDPGDARSIGSAATYARRYGLLSVLGYASSDEDDDGEAARGGDHPLPEGKQQACPKCGVIGSIIKGSPQYGGGWVCWGKRGGCGAKWPEGTDPYTVATHEDLMPKRKETAPPSQAALDAEVVAYDEDTAPQRFTILGEHWETKGIRREQVEELMPMMATRDKRGAAQILRKRLFPDVPETRALSRSQAAQFIEALKAQQGA